MHTIKAIIASFGYLPVKCFMSVSFPGDPHQIDPRVRSPEQAFSEHDWSQCRWVSAARPAHLSRRAARTSRPRKRPGRRRRPGAVPYAGAPGAGRKDAGRQGLARLGEHTFWCRRRADSSGPPQRAGCSWVHSPAALPAPRQTAIVARPGVRVISLRKAQMLSAHVAVGPKRRTSVRRRTEKRAAGRGCAGAGGDKGDAR